MRHVRAVQQQFHEPQLHRAQRFHQSGFEAGSTGMSNKMVDKLVFGGYINKELKDESSKNLRGVNYFGIALNYNMGAFIKGGKNYDF